MFACQCTCRPPWRFIFIRNSDLTVIIWACISFIRGLLQPPALHDLPWVTQQIVCDSNQAAYDWQSGWSRTDIDTHTEDKYHSCTTCVCSYRPAEITYIQMHSVPAWNMSEAYRRSSESIAMNYSDYIYSNTCFKLSSNIHFQSLQLKVRLLYQRIKHHCVTGMIFLKATWQTDLWFATFYQLLSKRL